MKAKILLFLLILITIVIKAQEPELQIEGDFDFKDLEAQYLTLDKSRIKTGLLREKAILYFVDFSRFTGVKNSDTADYYTFLQISLELKNSSVRQNAIDTDIFSKLPKNTDFYPIVILNFKYNEIRPDAFDKELIIERY